TAIGWRLFLLRLRTKITSLPITATVAMSEFIKRRLVKVGMKPDNVLVIHQGVDTKRFVPGTQQKMKLAAENKIDSNAVFLVSINRLVPFKRTDVTLRALAMLISRDVRTHLFVAGDGPLRAELESLAESLGVSQYVHWLGHYPSPEVLLQSCDVFVIASVGEAFGYVTAEAMSCGLPVVGSRSGSTPELVEHGRTGLLAEPLDPVSFANAIQTLTSDPSLRIEMGKSARDRAQNY